MTVTFSYLREFMLKPVEKLLDELEEWCRNRETFLEIAANDWGLLELLRERKEWKEEKEVLVGTFKEDGKDIRLTIDSDLQKSLYEQFKEIRGALLQ